MSKNFDNQTLTVSQKIYERLLLAYPQAHREEYGPAMAQLFRDQSRDAWSESRGWGMTKLWLRVLPDLVSTSIRERLDALNERKSMNEKIASLSHDRTTPSAIFIRVFLAVFLITVIAVTLITFLLPKSYASDAKLFFRYHSAEKNLTQNVSYVPHIIQSEVEIIGGDQVLGAAIKQLDLNSEWSKRYATGRLLNLAETIKMLRQRVIIHEMGNSPVLQVRVYDDKPDEVHIIAEGIIKAYLDYKAEQNSSGQLQPSAIFVIQSPSPPYLARPNKRLNIFFGVVAAGFLGLVAGGASALVSSRFGNRGRKNATPA
jgi:capsular polysaccharide biosynthesis protein